jgi:hypothetical protein
MNHPHKKTAATLPLVRCAIYPRKSTEEGLEQEFNSLDAQRESAEAFIRSQTHEGWTCLPDRYDDGSFTERLPEDGAKRLLEGRALRGASQGGEDHDAGLLEQQQRNGNGAEQCGVDQPGRREQKVQDVAITHRDVARPGQNGGSDQRDGWDR